jgi:hypothetical protein
MYFHTNLLLVMALVLVWVLVLVLALVFGLALVSFLGGSRKALGGHGETPGVLEDLLEPLGESRKFYDTLDKDKSSFIYDVC